MDNQKATTPEHVHGPDCDHDHDHGHDHAPALPYRREAPKLGRNDPCFCGSGKKFKKCHGAG
jgi:SEC-C motif